MYKRMLVPLDSSELAERVLPYAIQLTGRFGLETTFLHVCGPGESPSLFMCEAYIDRVAEAARTQIDKLREKMASSESTTGSVKSETITGDVPSSILEYADNFRADLILMSRHAHSGIGRWLIGSTALKVLAASRVPVLIIHPGDVNNTLKPEWPRKVLVPTDGSKLSEMVLEHVEMLLKQDGSEGEVTLLRICEPPDLLSDYPEAIMPLTWNEHVSRARAASERVCSTYLGKMQQLLEAKGIRVHTEVALGDNVFDEIIRYIREHPFDLVAMTTHGRSGISEWPYGHIADRLVQSVPIPLFLVRPLPL